MSEVLDLRGFNLNDKLELDPDFLETEQAHDGDHVHDEHCVHTEAMHEHGHDHHHAHHSDDIAAFVFKSDARSIPPSSTSSSAAWCNVYGPRMLRYKGVLLMAGADRKVVFQGVHQIMGSDLGAKWGENDVRGSKMVFIGKNLPKDIFISGLEQCLV
jgi:G3E family GTPase